MEAFIWFGGTFSPPTKEHISIIQAIAKKACELHPTGKITIGIVPVNAAYPSTKVQPECILPKERLELCKGLLEAAKSELSHTPRVQIKLIERDIRAPSFYSVYKSLKELGGPAAAKTVYIAVRERNMKEILQRLWEHSDELLAEYSFMPFGDSSSAAATEDKERMRAYLTSDYSNRKYRPSQKTIARNSADAILAKIHPLPGNFTDSVCSQKVRESLIALNDLMHPLIYKKFMQVASRRANIYQALSCGKDAGSRSGGRRRTRRKRL